MPTTGFFGFLWRFNAIAIAVTAVAAILICGVFGASFLYWLFAAPNINADTNLVPSAHDADKPNFVLGGGAPIDGTPYVVFYLMHGFGGSSLSSRGYDNGEVRNIMVVDGATATGQWLFGGTDKTIQLLDPLQRFVPYISPTGIAQVHAQSGLWLGVSNDGGTAIHGGHERKPLTLVVFSFGDRKLHTIVDGVDAVRGVHRIDDSKVLVVYEVGGKTVAATVSTADFSTTASHELPKLSSGTK